MKTDRLFSVQALRGFSALAVAWFHLTNGYPWDFVRWSGAYGYLGLFVFFVISGFVIPYSLHGMNYRGPTDFPRFILRRIVRLEPPYLASIVLVIALWYLSASMPSFRGHQPELIPGQLASHVFYFIPFTKYSWLQPIYWTLFYEFCFYVTVGMTYPLIAASSPIIVAALIATTAAASMLFPGINLALLFVTGLIGFRYFIGRDEGVTFIVLIIGCVAAMMLRIDTLTAAAATATIVIILFVRVPEWPALYWLGAISYSLYLIHVPIGGRIVNLTYRVTAGHQWLEATASLAALVISIAAAFLYWKAIEQPSQKMSQTILPVDGR